MRRDGVFIHHMPAIDVTRKLSWTSGYLVFEGETLGAAVQEFNRYNQRQITITDRSIVNVKVGGNFRTSELDSFTLAVQHMYGFSVQVGPNNGDIRISAGGQPP